MTIPRKKCFVGYILVTIFTTATYWILNLLFPKEFNASNNLDTATVATFAVVVYIFFDNWWFGRLYRFIDIAILPVIWFFWINPFGIFNLNIFTYILGTILIVFVRSNIIRAAYYAILNYVSIGPEGRSDWREYRKKYFPVDDPIRPLGRPQLFVLFLGSILFILLGAWAFISLPPCLVEGRIPNMGQLTCNYRVPDGMNLAQYRTLISNERQSVLWLLGGLVAVLTLMLTFRRDEVVRSDYRLSLRNHDLERDANSTARYSAALEHLGRPEEIEQIGALYSLLRIAKESTDDRDPICRLIAAYIKGCQGSDGKLEIARNDEDIFFPGFGMGMQERHKAATISVVPARRRIMVSIRCLSQITALDKDGPGTRPLYELDLEGVNFNLSNLSYGDFIGANLSGASFRAGVLVGVSFTNANLSSSDFTGADLRQADLGGTLDDAIFDYAQLGGASFTNASLQGCSFVGADLRGADLRFVEGLTRSQIEQAYCWNEKTIFPMDLGLPEIKGMESNGSDES